jgi:hypothetical protein
VWLCLFGVLIESGGMVEGRCGFVLLWFLVFGYFVCGWGLFFVWVFLWWFLVVGVVFGGFQDFSRFLAIKQDFFNFAVGEFWVVFCLRVFLLIF